MTKRIWLFSLICVSLLLTGVPASAEVVNAGATGLSLKVTAEVNAPRAKVFAALTERVGSWWSSSHTYSGSAANMRIEPQAGDDHRHAQRVRPDAFATAQMLVAVGFPSVFDGPTQTGSIINCQSLGKGGKEVFEIALRSDRMNDGDHGARLYRGLPQVPCPGLQA